jgi:holo-[acyl-carrier protein] synthase
MVQGLRTGVDLIEIDRLQQVSPAIRQRFLERVFTPRELEEAGKSDASLAGRFAAKEAVSKVLQTGIGLVCWKDIEIQRGPQGEPCLCLYGNAIRIASEMGLSSWSISISHNRTQAIAMVVALVSDKPVLETDSKRQQG